MATSLDIHIGEVKQGDRFRDVEAHGWDALSDATTVEDSGVPAVQVEVQYQPDGGCGLRLWHPNTRITILREI